MISHDKKCIFIHIPKCGGTSIEDVIWPKERGRTEKDLWMGFVTRFENKYQTGGLQHLLAWQVRVRFVSTNIILSTRVLKNLTS